MAVDWTGYRLTPDLSGLAQGIAAYGQNKQQAAQFQQEMDYKNRALAAEVARSGLSGKYAPKGQTLPVYATDKTNNVFLIGSKYNPNTDSFDRTYTSITSEDAQPDFGSIRIVSQEGLPSVSSGIARAKAEQAEAVGKVEVDIAGEKQRAINAADISSIYQKTAEQKRAENDAVLAAAAEKANTGYEMMVPLFNQIDSVLSNKKKEIYSGTTWDYVTGTVAPKVGVVFDQEKLNDTITVRQNIASLRTMAKPAGSGNPTEGEWARFDGMLPDPNTATRGELVTGYNNYVQAVSEWYKQNKQRGAGARVTANPETVAPANQQSPSSMPSANKPTSWGEW